ncbi:homoserine kinase [Anaerococcus kampingiae]|uniref:Homoserine kinase n=1 Tax=Anaerococcus kampingae TaxID=3115614 RepID=A0ABW9MCK1_9FIRM
MKEFIIKVPATSANVGCGFDSYGLSLNLFNSFNFRESDEFRDDNLVIDAYKYTFSYLGKEAIPIEVEIDGLVPMTRGLGSSSTCIVAGIYAALYILEGKIDKDLALDIAVEIEGHPDNVGPAIFGGLLLCVRDGERVYHKKIIPNKNLELIGLIPDFKLRTEDSRNVISDKLLLKDAINNIQRAAALGFALKDLDKDLIKICLDDKIHQPYRKSLIKGYDKIYNKSLELGALGVYLSGAGPTMMLIADKRDDIFDDIKKNMASDFSTWQVKKLKIDPEGAYIENL